MSQSAMHGSIHKRTRTPSPPAHSVSVASSSGTPQRRWTDGAIPGNRIRANTPISTPASRAARRAAIEKALEEVQHTDSDKRLKSMEPALSSVSSQEKHDTPSGKRLLPRDIVSPSKSSRKELIETVLHQVHCSPFSHARVNSGSIVTSPSPSPSSASQNHTLVLQNLQPQSPGPELHNRQFDAGYLITDEVCQEQVDIEDDSEDEIEDADMNERQFEKESAERAIQTNHVEDEDDISTINNFWSLPPTNSAIDSAVSSNPFTLSLTNMEVSANADLGSAKPDSALPHASVREPERVSWALPAPFSPLAPSPRWADSSRPKVCGGNTSLEHRKGDGISTLLTPPGSSQFGHHGTQGGAAPSTSICDPGDIESLFVHERRGRRLDSLQSPSPQATQGKGRQRSQWQMLQDDPENPFHERAAALRTDTVCSGPPFSSSLIKAAVVERNAEGQSRSADVCQGSLSAENVAKQVASLAALPEYIRRLERRERAAHKSAEIKAAKIAQLEVEIQRLRNTNRALEETVTALQVRR